MKYIYLILLIIVCTCKDRDEYQIVSMDKSKLVDQSIDSSQFYYPLEKFSKITDLSDLDTSKAL